MVADALLPKEEREVINIKAPPTLASAYDHPIKSEAVEGHVKRFVR